MENRKGVIADLHIHSRFSRACSKDITIENLEKWAKIKGIDILGTGDFTHDLWLKEIKENLTEKEGIYYSKSGFKFILTGEISLMYTQGRGRSVHLVLLAPNLETVSRINNYLDGKGRRDYDGRPIFKISCEQFAKDMKEISEKIEIIPAHCLTPYFGVFGSESGFDSLKEAFGNQIDKIHAIETGMSADPLMLWHISFLNNKSIVSFSDSHCVHPTTLITLGNGYILPIKELEKRDTFLSAQFDTLSVKSKKRIQFSEINSPKYLKKVKFSSGEIIVSDKHRFFICKDSEFIEKYAFELKRGDQLLRVINYPVHNVEDVSFEIPEIKRFVRITNNGSIFLKEKRKFKKLLQSDAARLLNLNKNHYYKVENGYVKIALDSLIKLSKMLKFNYDFFMSKYTNQEELYPTFPEKPNANLFELLGYFMGDGCFIKINRGKCLILTDKNKKMLKYYRSLIMKLFNCNSRLFKYSTKNSYGLVVPSSVAQFFILNFPEAVLKGKERRIPELVFNLSLDSIAGFLRGVFDAEGCFGSHNVDFCSANKLLLYQVDSLLKKFGICSSIYLNQLEKKKNKLRHRLFIFGEYLKIFSKKVNFNHPSKKIKIGEYLSKLKINRKSKLPRIGDFVLSRVESIESIKSDVPHLYDLAIDSSENYVANEIVVHNSFWPWRLGREATIFSSIESYDDIINSIRENKILGTVETDPAYGKYHYDGHALCKFSSSPEETEKLNSICPVCKKQLTIGVDNRVKKIRDQETDENKNQKKYWKILPLHELIALAKASTLSSKKTWMVYNSLIEKFGNEFNILLYADKKELIKELPNDSLLADLIIDNREGKIRVKPGYDGKYGVPLLKEKQEKLC